MSCDLISLKFGGIRGMCERFEHVCKLFPEVGLWWRIGKVRWVLNGREEGVTLRSGNS